METRYPPLIMVGSNELYWIIVQEIKVESKLKLSDTAFELSKENKTYIVVGYIQGNHKISGKSLLCDGKYSNGTYLRGLSPVDCVGNNIKYIDDLADSYEGR